MKLAPDGDPDHSQNLMESKLEQDPPSDSFFLGRSNEHCLHNPANGLIDKWS